jgi:hypothetical protein
MTILPTIYIGSRTSHSSGWREALQTTCLISHNLHGKGAHYHEN